MNPLRILVADDHEMIREGVRRFIENQVGWEVCGEASTGLEAIELAEKLRPDVVVIDMVLPGLNGVECTCRIKTRVPTAEVVLFTGNRSEATIRAAFEAGARSYILKSELVLHLMAAIEAVSRHKPYLTEDVSNVLFSRWMDQDKGRGGCESPTLTEREADTLQRVASGQSNKEVAASLGISIKTVEKHRAAIMRKLRLENVGALVRYAIRNQIIEA